jgi:membrane-bound serine protease (ClpP class)
MGKATPVTGSRSGRCRPLVALLLAALLPAPLAAGEVGNTGLIVPIPTSITTDVTRRLKGTLYGPLKRYNEARRQDPEAAGTFKLVCDFTPDGRANSSDDFGACYELAKYLHGLDEEGIQTVAWVHGDVTRHSVLPVLACREVFLSAAPVARLGQVTVPGTPLPGAERLAYEEVVRNRYPLPIVRKMYDPAVEVIKARPGDREKGTYRDGSDKPRPEGEVVLPPGDTALYNFAQAKEYGLCQLVPCNDLDEIRRRCDLPRASLFPPLEKAVVWRLVVGGQITGKLKDQFDERLTRALGSRANLIIVQLECHGGDSSLAYEMGMRLAGLEDEAGYPVQTVAYVTREAGDTAAFLALGCHKIVMQGAEGNAHGDAGRSAVLGGFEDYLERHPKVREFAKELDALLPDPREANPGKVRQALERSRGALEALEKTLSRNLAEVAEKQHYPALLAEGMVRHDLGIVEVVSARGASERRFLSGEDFVRDQKQGQPHWKKIAEVKGEKEKYLTLDAERARRLGLADDVVEDFDQLCARAGIDPAEVHTADPSWLDYLRDFLRHPWTSVALVMIGVTCLILELKMPGVGLPGVIAAVCFVLFFWAHTGEGRIVWLALLLFILGLLLIAVEMFVFPGLVVPGISGAALVLVSLGLVAYGHWPRRSEDWIALSERMGAFGLSIAGAGVAAFLLARYLPSIPYANRLLLRSPEEMEEEASESPPVHAELAALLGAIGVAATPLRPAGKVQFGEEFIDVIAEGSFVQPGTRVQVIEIEGNRVVVQSLGG